MKQDARRVTNDLFPSIRPVGRPKTSIFTRAEQLRQNSKAYRARKNQLNNIDDASSKLRGEFTVEMCFIVFTAFAILALICHELNIYLINHY